MVPVVVELLFMSMMMYLLLNCCDDGDVFVVACIHFGKISFFGKTLMLYRKQIYNLATLFSRSRASLVLSLPFFSKLDLDRAAREAWRGKDSRKSTEAREAGNAAFKVGKKICRFRTKCFYFD